MVLQREFAPSAETVGAVRSYVQQVLIQHGCSDEAIDAAVLCASELTTNALLHGEGAIAVEVELGERARVTVRDGDTSLPVLRRPDADDDGGRGLLIVSLFAATWGWDMVRPGKRVWFEIDLRDPTPAPPGPGVSA